MGKVSCVILPLLKIRVCLRFYLLLGYVPIRFLIYFGIEEKKRKNKKREYARFS
ncbi:hypothetical protein PGB90_009207 [Kerria lacca]